MRTLATFALLLAMPIFPARAEPVSPRGADVWKGREIAWRSRADGLAEARRDGKLALVIVQTTWCPVCRTYRAAFKNPKVVAAARDVVFILVDPEEEPDADRLLAPDGTYVPRSLFVDGDGRILESLKSRRSDYRHFLDADDAGELLALLKQARKIRSP
jgi:protein-disulfide reductase (glutathione)